MASELMRAIHTRGDGAHASQTAATRRGARRRTVRGARTLGHRRRGHGALKILKATHLLETRYPHPTYSKVEGFDCPGCLGVITKGSKGRIVRMRELECHDKCASHAASLTQPPRAG